ncbi:MAG: TonB-dependent receptor [Acidobacteria bacterium]|nr:TonB-dependent receptor [Acidobacteriota bacterium]
MKVQLFSLLLVLCYAMRAQTTGASLQGSVLDPGGAAIANASVEIRNTETNVSRTLTTDTEGRYREPQLLPGSYEIRASAQGFQTTIRKGVTLAVGQDGLIDFRLEIGRTDSSITVTEDVSPINLVSGSLTGLVNQSQMRDLPLNGRSFQQLAVLQPGVIGLTSAGNDVVGGRTPKISINGARPEGSSFLLDGTDINNVYNKTPGSVAGVLLGVEAVREFVVMTNAYSAEFGRSSGGVLNAVTRSGTNEFNGSLFHFHRNSAMDAKNFFDPAARKIPAFKRNQFGGVLGGPIRREKTFFFGAFESLIERLGVAGLTNVPDADARRGILPGRPQFQIHPLMPQYLSTFFPMPNGRNLGGGLAEYQFNNSQPTNEYFAQGRVDHRISDKDSLFGRFTFSNGNVIRQVTAKPPVNTTQERSRNQYLTLEEQHIFTPTLVNTLRLSYARSVSEANNVRTVQIPRELNWLPQEPFGYFTITGVVTEAAGDFRLPRNDYLNNYQWHNTMFWTKGAHGIRFGGEGQRMQFNQNTTSQQGGIVTFNGLENFLRGVPLSADFAVPGKIDPVRGYRQSLFGFFLQDDYRAKPNLTINLGVRYEFITVPTEVNGKISNLRRVTDSALTIGSPWHSNPSLRNFSPRVGMAWDPFKSGKTSVRAGFGIFYDQILPRYYFFFRQLESAVHHAHNPPEPAFPKHYSEFRHQRAHPRAVADRQLRPAARLRAAVQRLDPAIHHQGSGHHDRLCRIARGPSVPHRGREPCARDHCRRHQDLPADARSPEPQLHHHHPADFGCAILLQLTAGYGGEAHVRRTAGAGFVYVFARGRRFERHQFPGFRFQCDLFDRFLRPQGGSGTFQFLGEARDGGELVLRIAVFPERQWTQKGTAWRLAVEQHHDGADRAPVRDPSRIQSFRQSEHDGVFVPRAPGCGGWLRSGERRPGSLLEHQLFHLAGGQHARESRTQYAHRAESRHDGCIPVQGIQV